MKFLRLCGPLLALLVAGVRASEDTPPTEGASHLAPVEKPENNGEEPVLPPPEGTPEYEGEQRQQRLCLSIGDTPSGYSFYSAERVLASGEKASALSLWACDFVLRVDVRLPSQLHASLRS